MIIGWQHDQKPVMLQQCSGMQLQKLDIPDVDFTSKIHMSEDNVRVCLYVCLAQARTRE
jgi:hypothetical protein